MKNLLSILISICSLLQVYGQCPPDNNVVVTTQTELNLLMAQYPDCTALNLVSIGSGSDTTDPVISLAPLANITSINHFSAQISCRMENLSGLEALHTVTGDFTLSEIPTLTDLSALENLTTVGGTLALYRIPVSTLVPLNNITQLGGFDFFEIENSLNEFDFVFNTTSIPLNLRLVFSQDHAITTLSNLTEVAGLLVIQSPITDLTGLNNIVSVGHIDLTTLVSDLSPVSNLTTSALGAYFSCPNVTSLEPLSGLTNVAAIGFSNMPLVTSLNGLENITEIHSDLLAPSTGNIYLQYMHGLTDLSGLQNLTDFNGGEIYLYQNDNLSDISALSGVNPSSLSGINLVGNPMLSVCGYSNICAYLQNGGANLIYGNATGCNTPQEITASCTASVRTPDSNVVSVYPNPANTVLNIKAGLPVSVVEVYNALGQSVAVVKGASINNISVGYLPEGVYTCSFYTNEAMAKTVKFIISR